MPFRAEATFLRCKAWLRRPERASVPMPFRASTPFLRKKIYDNCYFSNSMYQCPFGLVLHFYKQLSPEKQSCISLYQCPFGLVLHFYRILFHMLTPQVLLYQCPLGLKLHFYNFESFFWIRNRWKYQCPLGLKLHFYWSDNIYKSDVGMVSMPSRAKAPFLRYPFKNLGFMRFLEPVFAGIYQNILTMTIFCAC